MVVCDTLSSGHAPTYQISLTYFKRQKRYCPKTAIEIINWTLGQMSGSNKDHSYTVIHVTTPYGHAHTYFFSQRQTRVYV